MFAFSVAGKGIPVLDWQARSKIAIGTARGLRYLHEDCRVGCIIHRNLRPSKILLTHDFEPLVCYLSLWKHAWRVLVRVNFRDGDNSTRLGGIYFEG